MIKFPKVKYSYKGKDCWHGQYTDHGAMNGHFGIRPEIEVNLSVNKSPFHLFYCLVHEMTHFIIRPLPKWLERFIEISLDVTLGKHEYELVYDLYKIFEKEPCSYCILVDNK